MASTRDSGFTPTLTVVIPVFNEVRTLHEVVERVLRTPFDKQLIIVDDGSTDGTPSLTEMLEARYPVEVLRHVENRGKGAAIRTALPHAHGRWTIIQDGDLEVGPEDYPQLLAPLLTGDADFVIGSRFSGSRTWTVSRAGVSVLNRCVRMLYGVRLTDEACCFKVLPTDVLRAMNLQCERFEFCQEVLAKACRMGLRIQEVSVRYSPRNTSEGKKLRYRDGLHALAALWRWRRWTPEQSSAPSSTRQAAGTAPVRDMRGPRWEHQATS